MTLRARRPRGEARLPDIRRDPDAIAGFLEDAAHVPGGYALAVAHATSEAGIAAALQAFDAVLPVGAQSSLTGGATPMGEVVLDTSGLDRILEIGTDFARVEAGVTLAALDAALERQGRYYPPAPTFTGACVGGTVATNAAGAASFKYGATRDWVQALTAVLPSGDVVDIRRGETRAYRNPYRNEYFELELAGGTVRVPAPRYRMPRVPKVSAGYFAAAGMDLIDLFIGSEGTLGVITEVTLRVLPERPAICLALVPFAEQTAALAFVRRLREVAGSQTCSGSHISSRSHDAGPGALEISAIEHMDARCLALLAEDGTDRLHGVIAPPGTAIALLVTLELPPGTSPTEAYEEIGRASDPVAPDTPLVRFCRRLEEAGVLDRAAIAVPGDRSRADHLMAVREAVPAAVNHRIARAQRNIDPRIEKTAADMIVPFEAFEELLARYQDAFAHLGLDAAVWGHVGDGHVHPNILPRSAADVEAGKAVFLAIGEEVIRLGGSPLAEHGVGRNPVKQRLLAAMYGEEGIEEMRRVKRALDPRWRLAPGVLFPAAG